MVDPSASPVPSVRQRGRALRLLVLLTASVGLSIRPPVPQADGHPSVPAGVADHLVAGRKARRAGAYEEAERHLREYQRWNGLTPALRLEWAMMQAQRGDLSEERYLRSSIRRGHADALFILEALAQGYMYSYRLTEAKDCLDRLLECEPQNIQALHWRAWVAEQRPHRAWGPMPGDDALPDYRRALKVAPDDFQARLRVAQILVQRPASKDDVHEGLEHLRRLRQSQPNNPALFYELAQYHLTQGDPDKAEEVLDKLLAMQPRHAPALVARARLALNEDRDTEAEGWLRQALAVDPYQREAYYRLAMCVRERDRGEAMFYLRQLERLNEDENRLNELKCKIIQSPHDPALRHEAGVIALRLGKEDEGLRWLDSALQDDPGHRPTHLALARYYKRTNRPDLAGRHRRLAQRPGKP